VPLLILRPAIIVCSNQEPFPGWTDTLAAAGILSMMASAGVTRYLVGNNYNRADLIPVDFVANAIIVGTAFQAGKDSLLIMHSASSHANPITWPKYTSYLML
jgi:alcohol-forming fatty acyl-CoA reductase